MVRLSALFAAPLVLAWGLLELPVREPAGRFAVRLVSSAVALVAGVVLAAGLLAPVAFSRAWPQTGRRLQIIAPCALLTVQVLAVIAAVSAVLASLVPRFPLPANVMYPSLCALAAALTWSEAHWLEDRHTAGVPKSRTSGDKLPDNGRATTASPRAEQI